MEWVWRKRALWAPSFCNSLASIQESQPLWPPYCLPNPLHRGFHKATRDWEPTAILAQSLASGSFPHPAPCHISEPGPCPIWSLFISLCCAQLLPTPILKAFITFWAHLCCRTLAPTGSHCHWMASLICPEILSWLRVLNDAKHCV